MEVSTRYEDGSDEASDVEKAKRGWGRVGVNSCLRNPLPFQPVSAGHGAKPWGQNPQATCNLSENQEFTRASWMNLERHA